MKRITKALRPGLTISIALSLAVFAAELSAGESARNGEAASRGATNLLINGTFNSNLNGWLDIDGGDSFYDLSWRNRDADGSSGSGSIYVKSKINAPFLDNQDSGAQCVSLLPNRSYRANASVYVPTPAQADGGTNHEGFARLRVRLFDGTDCAGSEIFTEFSGSVDNDDEGAWRNISVSFQTTSDTQSAWIQPFAANSEPFIDDPDPFEVHFDNIQLHRRFADLSVDLSARQASTQTNRNIVVDIEVDHFGPTTETPTNVLVSTTIPSGLTVVGAPNCDGSFNVNTSLFEWTIPSINMGQTLSCDMTLFIPTGTPQGSVSMTSLVNFANDPSPVNNDDSTSFSISPSRDLAVSIASHRDSFRPDETIRFDLMLENLGNTSVDNTTVEIDLLPGFDFPPDASYPFFAVSDCPDSGVVPDSPEQIHWTYEDTLPPGETTRCRIAISAGTAGGDMIASVPEFAGEVDTTNNLDFVVLNHIAGSSLSVDSGGLRRDDNPGDGVCRAILSGDCTFWAALDEANAMPGTDTIELPSGNFSMRGAGLTGPGISDSVLITGAGPADTHITGNTMGDGVILIDGSANADIRIRDLTVRNGAHDNGGGIEQTSGLGSLTLTNVVVSDNTATSNGGGISSAANLAVIESLIETNAADNFGGGVHFAPEDGQGMLRVLRSSIRENTANFGGGLTSVPGSGAPLTLESVVSESTIRANIADNNGGGIAGIAGGRTFVINSTIAENEAEIGGGGLYAALTSDIRLWNTTVTNNLYHTFISDGGLAGGGIYVDGLSSATARNSILLGNSKSGFFSFAQGQNCAGESLALERTNIIRITSFVNGADLDCSISGNITGRIEATFTETLEPLADNGGATLTHLPKAAGPAVDAGTSNDCSGPWPGQELGPLNLDIDFDQRGEFRPTDGDDISGARCDIGSVETAGDPPPSFELAVTVNGNGTVTSAPPGIDCPGDCLAFILDGTTVDLAASPEPGWTFTGWSGDCTGTGICSLTMNNDRSATAEFQQINDSLFADRFESSP